MWSSWKEQLWCMQVTSNMWYKIVLLLLNKMIFLMIKYRSGNLSPIKLMAKLPVTTMGWVLFTFIKSTNFTIFFLHKQEEMRLCHCQRVCFPSSTIPVIPGHNFLKLDPCLFHPISACGTAHKKHMFQGTDTNSGSQHWPWLGACTHLFTVV